MFSPAGASFNALSAVAVGEGDEAHGVLRAEDLRGSGVVEGVEEVRGGRTGVEEGIPVRGDARRGGEGRRRGGSGEVVEPRDIAREQEAIPGGARGSRGGVSSETDGCESHGRVHASRAGGREARRIGRRSVDVRACSGGGAVSEGRGRSGAGREGQAGRAIGSGSVERRSGCRSGGMRVSVGAQSRGRRRRDRSGERCVGILRPSRGRHASIAVHMGHRSSRGLSVRVGARRWGRVGQGRRRRRRGGDSSTICVGRGADWRRICALGRALARGRRARLGTPLGALSIFNVGDERGLHLKRVVSGQSAPLVSKGRVLHGASPQGDAVGVGNFAELGIRRETEAIARRNVEREGANDDLLCLILNPFAEGLELVQEGLSVGGVVEVNLADLGASALLPVDADEGFVGVETLANVGLGLQPGEFRTWQFDSNLLLHRRASGAHTESAWVSCSGSLVEDVALVKDALNAIAGHWNDRHVAFTIHKDTGPLAQEQAAARLCQGLLYAIHDCVVRQCHLKVRYLECFLECVNVANARRRIGITIHLRIRRPCHRSLSM